MDQMDKELELANYQGEDRVLPLTEVVEIYRRDNPQGEPLQSKLATLDKTIGGFFPGQLIVISGPTGMGKTTFSQTVTIALMEQMAFPLWFSFEVDCLDFARVFPHDATKFVYVPAKLKETAPVWIEDKIIEAKMKYDVKAVFIDHLHYLVSMNPKQNQSYMIGNTVRGLKQLALKHKVVMFLIAHMQKTQNDEEPGLGQIRDCLAVGQEVYLCDGSKIPVENITSGANVLSYKSIRKLQGDTVIDVWPTGKKKIYRLVSQTGRIIEASAGHRFYAATFNKGRGKFGPHQNHGIQGWTRLKDLKVGQKILVVRKYPDVVPEWEYVLTEDQALLLGWIAGAGHISKRYNTELTISTKKECDLIKSVAEKAWGLAPRTKEYSGKSAYRLYLTSGQKAKKKSNLLTAFLKKSKYCPISSNKHAHPAIFTQDERTVAAYLQGLFQADGSINMAGHKDTPMAVITLHTISERLAKEVKHLLLRIGIVGWIRKQNMKNSGFRPTNGNIYVVALYGPDVEIFMEQIGFLAEKQERALRILEGWNPKKKRSTSDFLFERVKSIEYVGEKETYDVQVRGHHRSLKNNSFCVEDFITHNSSFVEQEADTVMYCWRPPADRTITIVKVAKNRKRGVMDVKIELTLQGGRYYEQEKRYGEE